MLLIYVTVYHYKCRLLLVIYTWFSSLTCKVTSKCSVAPLHLYIVTDYIYVLSVPFLVHIILDYFQGLCSSCFAKNE